MDLKFLGTGSAFSPEMGDTSACFVSGRRLVLLDCGETVFARLKALPEYLGCAEVLVLVTHLHADHVGSLGTLISYGRYGAGGRVTVAHPTEAVVHLLDLLGLARADYDFLPLRAGIASDLGEGLSAKPFEVEHVPGMRCFGYLLSEGLDRTYYGGDARTMPPEILAGLREGSIDRVYQDAGGGEKGDPAHAGLAQLESLVPSGLRAKVFCVHLDSGGAERARARGFGTVTVVGN